MKIASLIAGILLGFVFVASGLVILLNLAPPPPPFPEGSASGHFMAAFMKTGYMTFVKVLEVVGGVLVAMNLRYRVCTDTEIVESAQNLLSSK